MFTQMVFQENVLVDNILLGIMTPRFPMLFMASMGTCLFCGSRMPAFGSVILRGPLGMNGAVTSGFQV